MLIEMIVFRLCLHFLDTVCVIKLRLVRKNCLDCFTQIFIIVYTEMKVCTKTYNKYMEEFCMLFQILKIAGILIGVFCFASFTISTGVEIGLRAYFEHYKNSKKDEHQ